MPKTLDFAIIQLAGWDDGRPTHDPMCGWGTLLCEVAREYCRISGGHLRDNFGFERLPDFDPILWKAVRQRMDEDIRPLPEDFVFGRDSDGKAAAVARANLKRLPGGEATVLGRHGACPYRKIRFWQRQNSGRPQLCFSPSGKNRVPKAAPAKTDSHRGTDENQCRFPVRQIPALSGRPGRFDPRFRDAGSGFLPAIRRCPSAGFGWSAPSFWTVFPADIAISTDGRRAPRIGRSIPASDFGPWLPVPRPRFPG